MNQSDQIAEALAKVRAPLFLARAAATAGGPLVLHTTERSAARQLRDRSVAALTAAGLAADCRVVTHRPRQLARARSLELLARRLSGGDVVFDPTGIVARVEAIVDFAQRLRARRPEIERLFIDGARRTLFVIVDRKQYPDDNDKLTNARAATLAAVTEALVQWRAEKHPNFDLAIRIGFEPPADAQLVAVDRQTVALTIRSLFRGRFARQAIKAAAASAIGLVVTVPAMAQTAAVSQPNISILTRGGWVGGNADTGFAAVGAKVALPIVPGIGVQGDFAVGTQSYTGIGGHLFLRDPTVGLLGGFASAESMDGVKMQRFGAEEELYLGAWTIQGTLGHQSGDVTNGTFGNLDVTFYATPNFSLTGGYKFDPDGGFGNAGFEWQPAMSGLHGMSFFADGQFGDTQHERFLAGIDFHFGAQPRTLMDRDRRDDPFFTLFNGPLTPHVGYITAPPPP